MEDKLTKNSENWVSAHLEQAPALKVQKSDSAQGNYSNKYGAYLFLDMYEMCAVFFSSFVIYTKMKNRIHALTHPLFCEHM